MREISLEPIQKYVSAHWKQHHRQYRLDLSSLSSLFVVPMHLPVQCPIMSPYLAKAWIPNRHRHWNTNTDISSPKPMRPRHFQIPRHHDVVLISWVALRPDVATTADNTRQKVAIDRQCTLPRRIVNCWPSKRRPFAIQTPIDHSSFRFGPMLVDEDLGCISSRFLSKRQVIVGCDKS